jgi:RNA polymerase sigma factor for flagellar operon FliA
VEDEEMAEALGVTLADFHGLLNDTNRVSLLDIENLPRQLTGLKNDELLQLLRDDEHRDPAFQLSLFEIKKILAQAIERLSQKEKTIISLYYYEEMTLKEIGQIMGFTESRICQIHSKVILKLRAQLKKVFDAER